MEREMEYLLGLLKGFLWEQPPQAAEGLSWQRLQELAQIHSVSGILGYMTMLAPIAPEEMRPQLRQDCIQTMNLYNRRATLAQALLDALAQLGVDSCTMKGLVVRQLYPVPELRSFNDVDILIRQQDQQKVHDHLLAQGFSCDVDYGNVYCYRRGPEYYEVHSRLVSRDVKAQADYPGFFDRAWEHSAQTAPHRFAMDKEFHLVYLLAHLAKHVAGYGAGVRMYLDVAAWVKAWDASMDWQCVFAWLGQLQLREFGCSVLSAVESWFAVPCRAEFQRLNSQILENFAQFTLEAGIFGHHGRDNAMAVLKSSEGSRFRMLLKRIFPSAKSLENRFPYLKTKPWLLPAAWVQRAWQSKGGTPSQFAREAKGIMTYSQADAQRLKDICKEIGL